MEWQQKEAGQTPIKPCWCVWALDEYQDEAAPVGSHGKRPEVEGQAVISRYGCQEAEDDLEDQ